MSSPKHIKRNITTKQLKHISVHATYGWIEALLHTDFYIMSYVVDLFKLIEKILTHIAHKSASCIAWARRGIFCVNQTSSFQSHAKKKKKKVAQKPTRSICERYRQWLVMQSFTNHPTGAQPHITIKFSYLWIYSTSECVCVCMGVPV